MQSVQINVITPKIAKAITESAQNNWPVYWTYNYGRGAFELRAVTYTWENGNDRTRHLAYARDFPHAAQLNRQLSNACPSADRKSLRRLCLSNQAAFAKSCGRGGYYGDEE